VANFDFSSPFVAARIRLPNGDAFPLWTNIGGAERNLYPVAGTEEIQALAFLQEVQVELNLSELPKITAQLSPPFEDGMKFINSPLADGLMRNTLEVQFGYSGGTGDGGAELSPPYIGTLMAPEVTVDTEIQISLKAQGLARSAQTQGGRVVGRTNEKIENIIRRIAEGETGGRRVLEVDFSEIERGSETWNAIYNTSAENYSQGGRSDWVALWELAERTNCVMLVTGTSPDGVAQLQWIPKNERWRGPPKRRYRLFHFPGGEFRSHYEAWSEAEMPIISFSCNTEAIWNAVTYQDILNSGAQLNGVDADNVSASRTPVTLEGLAEPVDSTEGAQTAEPSDRLPDSPMILPGDPDNPEAVRRAEAEVGAGAGMVVAIQLEVLGDPTILPGEVIAVGGLGLRFDRRVYHVDTISHSIGMGGFSTTIVAHSNIDPRIREDTRQPTGQRNRGEVETVAGYVARSEGL